MSKVLLITGASRGIGAETARLAAAHGYSLCLNYLHNERAANELLEALTAGGHQAIMFQANIGIESEVEAMFRAIDRDLGRLDGLVNNAGINGADGMYLEDCDDALTKKLFEVNTLGVYYGLKHGPKHMNDGGSIINTASLAASYVFPGSGPYSATTALLAE